MHTLIACDTEVSDLGPLSGLKNLRLLDLGDSQITDLEPLSGLSSLQGLLVYSAEICDLSPLAELLSLQTLNVGSSKVVDLGPLSSLLQLQVLIANDTAVEDLSPLAGLSSLQRLELNSTSVRELGPLSGLENLRVLEVGGSGVCDLAPLAGLVSLCMFCCSKTRVRDLSPLSKLSDLIELDCSNTQVSDLGPLSGLLNLQVLNFSQTQVSDLGALSGLLSLITIHWREVSVSCLAPLSGLRNLEVLSCGRTRNPDLGPLSGLSHLSRLTLDCAGVSELSSLSGLLKLEALTLCGSHVPDLAPLSGLPSLGTMVVGSPKVLTLKWLLGLLNESPDHRQRCKIESLPAGLLFAPALQNLDLRDAVVAGVPPELLADKNCLPALRGHIRDLEAGSTSLRDVKVFVLGNGRVGKTQLCNRILGKPFDEHSDSTHGVQVLRFPLESGGEAINLNVWDFGGQDLYHGTHALFLSTRAVFVVVWHPEFEEGAEVDDSGHRFRNHPLPYWLDYVHHLGGNVPLLLVQSRCEALADEEPVPPAEPGQLQTFRPCKVLHYSAKTDRGAGALREALREAALHVLQQEGVTALVGTGRLEVQRTLERWRAEDAERASQERLFRTLTTAQFVQLCEQVGGVSSWEELLRYLHRVGVVFYKAELFQGVIILDQSWALDAVYAVFDRQSSYGPLGQQHGRFTTQLLGELVWQGYQPNERALFVSLMCSCGVAFEHRAANEQLGVEAVYVAPDLLPELEVVVHELVGRWSEHLPMWTVCYRYSFLHAGIIRGLLTTIGGWAQSGAVYWKYGAWLYDWESGAEAVVEQRMEDGRCGEIALHVKGARPQKLMKRLRETLEKQQRSLSSTTAEVIEIAGAGADGEGGEQAMPASPPRPDTRPSASATQPKIYVSYAWNEPTRLERRSDALVDRMCAALEKHGLSVIRDRQHLGVGESISRFIRELSQGDYVIAVISQQYLRSRYCMRELYETFQQSVDDQHFQQRLIPLVQPDADVDEQDALAKHVAYWEERERRTRNALASLPDAYKGPEMIKNYQMEGDIARNMAQILALVTDRMVPRDLERMAEEGFQEVLALVGRPPRRS